MSNDSKNNTLLRAPLAIVGMACRLPGAESVDEYWRLLMDGASAVAELPPDRLDRGLYYDPTKGRRGKTYSTLGGLVKDRPLNLDDCLVSAEEQGNWDPCHLILCEVAAAACRDAGFVVSDMARNTGVYIGHAAGSPLGGELVYATLAEQTLDHLRDVSSFAEVPTSEQESIIGELVGELRQGRPRRHMDGGPHLNASAAAALIARALKLNGPHVVVEAACASSLVALALGAMALQEGEIEAAIIGGASFNKSDTHVLFSHAQSTSATGSRPFDEAADGLVISEGYVVLVIKTLSRALLDGDRVHAVIRGVGMATDGHGRSLWAPRKEGQVEALRRAYAPDVDPSEVQYIEAHATSTQVGDATEMQALAEFYGPPLGDKRIPIGSMKSNLGHTLETAGLAGLLKTVLAIQHGVIPPTIGLQQLNTAIPWAQLPFSVPTEPTSWPQPTGGRPRRAGVNAFGIGGLNVHIVLDEFDPRQTASQPKLNASPRRESDQQAIAVVGRGLILPGAQSVEALADLIASRHVCISEPSDERWRRGIGVAPGPAKPWQTPTRRGGFIDDYAFDWKRYRIPPKQVARANPLQFMLLDAARQALREAGYEDGEFDRARTAVVIGTLFGGEFGHQLLVGLRLPELRVHLIDALRKRGITQEQSTRIANEYEELLLNANPALLDETGSFTSSTLASRIAKELDLMGGAMAIDAAECSSLAALDVAGNLLRSGACSLVMCGAAQRSMDLATYEALAMQGRLARDGPTGTTDGYLPGEGVALVLLKRLAEARRDGDRILGVIRGIAGASDGSSVRRAVETAARRALERSPIAAGEVTRHDAGCGIQELDTAERQSLQAVYGQGTSTDLPPLLSQIGHTQAAHGLVTLIRHTLPTAGGGSKQPVSVTTPATSGLAYHLLLEPAGNETVTGNAASSERRQQRDRPRAITERRSSRIARFGAASPEQLVASLTRASQDVGGCFAAAQGARFSTADTFRLAIVATDVETLATKMKLAEQQWQHLESRPLLARQDIFYGELSNKRPRVAFLFPGLGSQYAGMLRSLVEVSPAARAAMKDADRIMQQLGYEQFSELVWTNEQQLGNDLWVTQVSMLLADTLLYRALLERGIHADCVSGHSFGEYPAMVAAGVWSLEQAIRVTRARADSIAACEGCQGRLLSISAAPQMIESLISRHPFQVYCTHHNAPQQTVVGGDPVEVQKFSELLRAERIAARMLPVPTAFHTPLMKPAQGTLRRALDEACLCPPATLFLSGVTNGYVSDPHSFRDNLVQQLVVPVRYCELAQRLADDGVNVLVEVGPQQVLTKLNRQILADRDVTCVASDDPQTVSDHQLDRVQAVLECAGVTMTNPAKPAKQVSEILSFDAMTRRKERLGRQAGTGNHRPARAAARADTVAPDDAPAARDELEDLLMTFARQLLDLLERRQKSRLEVPLPATTANPLADDLTRPVDVPTPQPNNQPRRQLASMEKFLVDFVVEHTGYPPEMVELDAEFEADLGIDSIKLAQLFGELRERLDLEVDTNSQFALSDFRTLRDVLAALESFGVDAESGGPNGHWETPSSDLGEFPDWRADTPRPTEAEQPVLPSSFASSDVVPTTSLTGMEEFLVNFIVEHTGYPPEMVELDAEFEADLGIDSIKLAQLFGELREHFSLEVSASDQFALSDFRTLQDVLSVLKTLGVEQAPISQHRSSDVPSDSLVHRRDAAPVAPVPSLAERSSAPAALLPAATVADVPVQRSLNGSHYETGLHRGQERAREIKSLLRQMANRLGKEDREVLHIEIDPSRVEAYFSSEQLEEMRGLADGAGVHVGNVMGYNFSHPREMERTDTPLAVPPSRTDLCSEATPGQHSASSDEPGVVNDSAANITRRYVLRTVPSPPASGGRRTTPLFNGAALILGDNAVAESLQARLQQLGTTAYVLKPNGDPSSAVAELDRIWQREQVPHLFLVTPRDEDALTTFDWGAWENRRAQGVMTPFWLCQRWLHHVMEADLMDDASIIGALSLGGQFGFSGDVVSAESGAITGLLKSIMIESWVNGYRTIPVKLVDATPDEPAQNIVAGMCGELTVPSYDVEIAWSAGERQVVRALAQPLERRSPQPVPRHSTWVITGGARGITAFVAHELGQRYDLKLNLIGRAPHPDVPNEWRDLSDAELKQLKLQVMQSARESGRHPVREWENAEKALEIDATLRELAGLGISAKYFSCDVSDPDALEQVLREIRRTAGPITGIVHGAGVGKDARFDHKVPEKVDQCIRAKVDGTLALMTLTQSDPIKYFVAFGSISGRFGANGHTDYSLANDMMAKLVAWYRGQRPDVAAVTFHWHAWGDVGMAVKPETRLALEMVDMQFMPAREGVNYLINELEAGAPESEVLITDSLYYRRFYPAETLLQPNAKELYCADGRRRCPLLDRGETRDAGDQQITSVALNPLVDPFLVEHRLEDRPLLPIVVGLEFLCEAAQRLDESRKVIGLRNVAAVNGLRFHNDQPQTVRARAQRSGEASVQCELVADFTARNGKVVEADRVYLNGTVDLGTEPLSSGRPMPNVSDANWHQVQYPPRGSKFYLGPPLRCLRKIQMTDKVAWGRVAAPAAVELTGPRHSSVGWILPSAILDACLYATGLLAWFQIEPHPALPASIDLMRLGRRLRPGEVCLVETRFVRREGRYGQFDFTLFGMDGEIILEVEGYRIVWLSV